MYIIIENYTSIKFNSNYDNDTNSPNICPYSLL